MKNRSAKRRLKNRSRRKERHHQSMLNPNSDIDPLSSHSSRRNRVGHIYAALGIACLGFFAIIQYVFVYQPYDSMASNARPLQSQTANLGKTYEANRNEQVKANTESKNSEKNKLPVAGPSEFHKQVLTIVKDTPMEKMVTEIAKRDRAVAAYIVGIAMKESKFGKYSPKKNGKECFNYWGYRGKENTTQSGYSCFNSPQHAIKVVGDRIESMLGKGSRTPAQMISWKCGSSCAGHSNESVQKWIADVSINYYKLNPHKQIAKSK
ncbi:hypothetical protein HGA64_02260 [Candidatus Falkowbacteria bacterium]|nr:hypothetical protein [Candidatus Falkowbacteria bacterium]